MAITPVKHQSGLSKLIGVAQTVVGGMTGNPLMIAQGLGTLSPKSSLGKIAGVANSVNDMGKAVSDGAAPEISAVNQDGTVSADKAAWKPEPINGVQQIPDYNPIENELNKKATDVVALRDRALSILQDPSTPQEYRDMYAEPFLRHKHYGRFG